MSVFYFIAGILPLEVISIKIGFIGAGKVGFSIGKFFVENKVQVSGYYSKNPSSSKEASEFTNSRHFERLEDLINESQIIFITVPDDEILNVYSKMKLFSLKDKIICHTSGCLSSQVFPDIDDLDAYSYSIHPMFPISQKKESYKYLKNAVFTIEGHEKYLNYLKDIFISAGVKIIAINSNDKRLYHLASVTVSNLFLALINRSCGYLREYGFSEEEALNALYPLILTNVDNALKDGIVKALTGPAERGDLNTIKKHMSSMPEAHKKVYLELTKELLSISREKNRDRDYSTLETYLGGL